jgi:hypothetical protein
VALLLLAAGVILGRLAVLGLRTIDRRMTWRGL